MGKKWKYKDPDLANGDRYGKFEESYNAVFYEYDTKRLAKPTGIRNMSDALIRFRENVKKNNTKTIAFVSGAAESNEVADELETNVPWKKKKKSKDKRNISDESNNTKDGIENVKHGNEMSVIASSSKPKKKKKSKKADSDISFDGQESTPSKKKKSKKGRNVSQSIENTVEECDNPCRVKKKSKKASRNKNSESDAIVRITEAAQVDVSEKEHLQKKTKKKKRNIKNLETVNANSPSESYENAIKHCDGAEQNQGHSAKKRKANLVNSETNETSVENPVKKKKRKKNKKDDLDAADSQVFDVSSDAVPKKKKKKSKGKTEVSDNPTEAVSEGVADNMQNKANAGQWNNVSLDNSERTSKFLRLMGGLKENGKSLPSSKMGSKFNSALNKSQEEKLNSALEEQFLKAKEAIIQKGRGVGLGFAKPPGAGKKFYIDETKSKSVKFDD